MFKRKMVVSDLDDTLLTTDKELTIKNIKTIQALRKSGVVVVIATGRPLHFVRQVNGLEELVDYIVVSTGLGVWDCIKQDMLFKEGFSREESQLITNILIDMDLCFMKHDELPDNHFCQIYYGNEYNSDFYKRLENFDGLYTPLYHDIVNESSFFMIPGVSGSTVYDRLKKMIPWASFVKMTSPYDLEKYWIEILPSGVNKGMAVKALANFLKVDIQDCLVIGNDHNDTDMLMLTDKSYVVKNAVRELKEQFIVTDDCNNDGFTAAVIDAEIIRKEDYANYGVY